MNSNIYILKFCGMFDVGPEGKRKLKSSDRLVAKRLQANIENDYSEWRYIHEQYYPNFTRFISNESPSIDDFTILTEKPSVGQRRYSKGLLSGQESLTLIPFTISSVEIFLFKKSPGIISLEVQIDAPDINLSTITSFINQIRNYSSTIIEIDSGITIEMISLIQDEILNKATGDNTFNLSYPFTEEGKKSGRKSNITKIAKYRGSKLKVFQCFNLTEKPTLNFGQILFSLGTLTPINKLTSETEYNSHSKQYLEETVSNCISVYNNWAALCLFDTFTMVGYNYLTQPMTLKTWQVTYFRIFVYDLYYKYYLFSINSENMHEKKVLKRQRQELNEFIQLYDTPYISYNFLPNLIHEKIRNGIKAGEETEKLRNKVEWMTGLINEEKRDVASVILFCLALFAILPSNMKDLYDNGLNWINVVALSIKIIVLLAIYLYYWFASRKSIQ